VKEVAAALGYHDPLYFSRVFKSVNHMAPSDYRALGRRSSKSEKPGLPRARSATAQPPVPLVAGWPKRASSLIRPGLPSSAANTGVTAGQSTVPNARTRVQPA
jgi:hypothetical protein